MRQNAANWLELAAKVWNLRRDRLTPGEAEELTRRRDNLRKQLKERAGVDQLKAGIEALEDVLRDTGGKVYPKSSLTENIEFFLVAAIVILGIRTYFVQPFTIPTNSMWPTYYGMTAENFPISRPAPGLLEEGLRFATLGAVRKEAIAPRRGEIAAVFWGNGYLAFNKVEGRKWLFLPDDEREYTFYVDGEPVAVRVPEDFSDMDTVFAETYFGDRATMNARLMRAGSEGRLQADGYVAGGEAYRFAIGRRVEAGQPVVRFDLLTGDKLFVDRLSYHFVRPRVGQGFVFRTDLVPGIAKQDYYIKRLVGVPGDVIQIHPPVLYRNGKPITGAKAFDLNANRVSPYAGYVDAANATFLPAGGSVTVPSENYFAMGDNSSDSEDGRYWGLVPAVAVIGRPLFIYYPLTRRWGPAR